MTTTGDEARKVVALTFKNYKAACERVEYLRLQGSQDPTDLAAMQDALDIMAAELARYNSAQSTLARYLGAKR